MTDCPRRRRKTSQHYEVQDFETSKARVSLPVNADYSGAVATSDAAEIALVRKLDWCIMPALWTMCFLTYLDRSGISNSVILGWVSATLGQTTEKKTVSVSIVNLVAYASYIYTAYLYPKSDGPKYLTAIASNAAFAFMTIACAWVLRLWLQRTNQKLRDEDREDAVYYAY